MNLSPPVTIVLIDQSWSMTNPVGKDGTSDDDAGKTRWQASRTRVEKLLETLPDGSLVQIGLFCDKQDDSGYLSWSRLLSLDDSGVRSRLLKAIDESAPQKETWLTPLYDALQSAVDKAIALSLDDPTRDITVLVYSDGQHKTSGDPSNDASTLRTMREDFASLADRNENFWLYFTPIGSGQSVEQVIDHPHAAAAGFEYPLPIQFDRASFLLPDPRVSPLAEIPLTLCASSGSWARLSGKQMSLEFVPDGDQPIRVKTDPVTMQKGQVFIPIRVTNPEQLDPKTNYSGRLIVNYPKLKEYELRGPPHIRLNWQLEKPPKIIKLLPADGTTVATDTDQTFAIQTLQGSDIVWDFGDGQTAKGPEVRHRYNTAGDRTVTVSVTGPNRFSAPQQTIRLNVIDLSVALLPIKPPVVVGLPCVLKCKTDGPVEKTAWYVDGARRASPESNALPFTFLKPGEHEIYVRGSAEQAGIESDRVLIQVEPPPKITLDGSNNAGRDGRQGVRIGNSARFRTIVPRGYERIDWEFWDGTKVINGGETQSKKLLNTGKMVVRASVFFPGDRSLQATMEFDVTAQKPRPRPKIRIQSKNRSPTGLPPSPTVVSGPGIARLPNAMAMVTPFGMIRSSTVSPINSDLNGVSIAEVFRLFAGQTLVLEHDSEGDYQQEKWRYRRLQDLSASGDLDVAKNSNRSWVELSDAVQTLTLDQPGFYEVEILLMPYGPVNSHPEPVTAMIPVVVFPPQPAWVFWATATIAFLVAIVAWWLFAHGNWPSKWEIQRGFRPVSYDRTKMENYNPGNAVTARWDVLNKQFQVDLSEIELANVRPDQNYWKRGQGPPHCVTIKKQKKKSRRKASDLVVSYSGESQRNAEGRIAQAPHLSGDQEEQYILTDSRIGDDFKLFLRIQKIDRIPWGYYLKFLCVLGLMVTLVYLAHNYANKLPNLSALSLPAHWTQSHAALPIAD